MAMRLSVTNSIPGRWLAWLIGLTAAVSATVLAANYARFPGDPRLARWLQSVELPGLGSLSAARTS